METKLPSYRLSQSLRPSPRRALVESEREVQYAVCGEVELNSHHELELVGVVHHPLQL